MLRRVEADLQMVAHDRLESDEAGLNPSATVPTCSR